VTISASSNAREYFLLHGMTCRATQQSKVCRGCWLSLSLINTNSMCSATKCKMIMQKIISIRVPSNVCPVKKCAQLYASELSSFTAVKHPVTLKEYARKSSLKREIVCVHTAFVASGKPSPAFWPWLTVGPLPLPEIQTTAYITCL
jgi:hypothetical protein